MFEQFKKNIDAAITDYELLKKELLSAVELEIFASLKKGNKF